MARINIENTLFTDIRWNDLLLKCGCKYKALGIVTTAWILAQQNWIKYGNVPPKAWAKELDILIDVELAIRNEDGSVYVKGSKKAFKWLNQKSEAGKKGGRGKSKSGSNAIKATMDKAYVNRALTADNDSEPPTLTLTLTPTLTQTPIQTQTPTQTLILTQEEYEPTRLHKLAILWNLHRRNLPKVIEMSKKRERLAKSVFHKLTENDWVSVIKKIAASEFCSGKNDRGWQANFDFLIKPDTYIKALEGAYDTKTNYQYGKTEDGRYLTPAMKRSHNNKLMIEKYLKPKEENDEPIKDVGSDSVDS